MAFIINCAIFKKKAPKKKAPIDTLGVYYGSPTWHDELKDYYNRCCAWCGDSRNSKRGGTTLCVDHVQTRYSGGSDYERENFQILCRRCNSIKGRVSLDALPPRLPETDLDVILAKQEKLKQEIMPARRRTRDAGLGYPRRAELGY
tara:strand:+ start:165 stop:602 length:438 start_codon:yes stop_codon:yes gene_type:complete